MKSHPKICTVGEVQFVVEQKHAIEFVADGMLRKRIGVAIEGGLIFQRYANSRP